MNIQYATVAYLDDNPWMSPDDVWYGRDAIGQLFRKWNVEASEEEPEGAFFYDSDSDGEDEYVYYKQGQLITETYKKEGCNKHYYEIFQDETCFF